jgi:hypothetical protein
MYTKDSPVDQTAEPQSYEKTQEDFVKDILSLINETSSETAERNEKIQTLDSVIYGAGLKQRLKLPAGHDLTEVNWLRRAVEVHTDQFMGNGFQIVSTYNSKDQNVTTPEDKERIRVENKVAKEYADQRRSVVQSIIDDNGGVVLFKELASNASAVGDSVIKSYYDEDEKRWMLSQVESVENFYAIWSSNDFRKTDAVAYVYQISQATAARMYDCDGDTPTSPLGQPLKFTWSTPTTSISDQKMVTVIEVTGIVRGWAAENGKLKKVEYGKETELNALTVGNMVKRFIGELKKLPRYYILPNKRYRRRPWGVSDITDAAIDINLTYIETLSDWRTVASKVNFPKFKVMGVGADVQIPKPKSRTIEMIPLSEGQDIAIIDQGDANQIDFKAQLEELKEQFVRETAISRVLFSDPTITLNSNQALMTSMKPTTDVAVAKKALWAPILTQIFTDALETLAEYDDTIKELVKADDDWYLKVVWPDYSAKYDPSASSMLINRFNAGLISIQSYMEQMGESKEEMDRIEDELTSPASAAIIGKQLPLLAQGVIQQPQPSAAPAGPGGTPGNSAQISTPANNTPGSGIMSQPGSGATSTSPTGAVAQAAQVGGA